jgi:hypothetical protein
MGNSWSVARRLKRGRCWVGLGAAVIVSGMAFMVLDPASGAALAGSRAAAVAHAQSGPPDLTGSWSNKQNPTGSPPWQLTASNGLHTLDASWTGGAGHTGLHGTFHGSLTLITGGIDAYKGTFQVTEAGNTATGSSTFAIDNANQIEIYLTSTSGAVQHYTFVRVGGSSGGAVPTIATTPTPAAFDTPVTVAAPAPGNAATNTSPPLGNASSVTSITDGLTPDDLAVIPYLVPGFRHTCYLNFLAGIFSRTELTSELRADGSWGVRYVQIIDGVPKALADLAVCMAYVDALQAAASAASHSVNMAAASAANVGCGGFSTTIAARGSGRKLRAKKITHRRVNGVHVVCQVVGGRLAITFSTGSKKPLSRMVGSRLHLLVLRGKGDTTGGNLTFSYHKG